MLAHLGSIVREFHLQAAKHINLNSQVCPAFPISPNYIPVPLNTLTPPLLNTSHTNNPQISTCLLVAKLLRSSLLSADTTLARNLSRGRGAIGTLDVFTEPINDLIAQLNSLVTAPVTIVTGVEFVPQHIYSHPAKQIAILKYVTDQPGSEYTIVSLRLFELAQLPQRIAQLCDGETTL